MPSPEQSPPLSSEEFRRIHQQIDDLLAQLTAGRAGSATDGATRRQIAALVKTLRDRTEHDWTRAQHAVNTLVRTQTAQGLAARFMERAQPYKEHAELSALLQDGLLHHATFIQKSPSHLRFYKGVFAAIEPQPRRILEIGVKGGGSVAFWKALFPAATVVGLDIKLRPWLTSEEAAADGVIYVQGDQSDARQLADVARTYGPFDLVIDDGSHVAAHQETSLRTLLPGVAPGGFYVIEDIHTSVKAAGTRAGDYGDDIWADFLLAIFQRLRRGPAPADSPGARLARDMAPRIAEVRAGRQVLALRAKDRTEEA